MRIARIVMRRFRGSAGVELDLPPGLIVIEGPNEAGKSTLLAFVQALLFPHGRQGSDELDGSLDLTHPSGARYRVERRGSGRNSLRLQDLTTGRSLEPQAFARMTGNLEIGVYRSVFAFGLSELQGSAALTSPAVKERLYSAAVAGAGENAANASKSLEDELGRLLKPRTRSTLIATHAAQLSAHLAEVTEAQGTARSYAALLTERDTAALAAAERRRAAAQTATQHGWTKGLLDAWPLFRKAREASLELERLEPHDEADAARALNALTLAHAGAIDELERGLEAHLLTSAEANELTRALSAEIGTLRSCLDELGPDFNAKRLASLGAATTAGYRERATAAAQAEAAWREERANLDGRHSAARRALSEARAAASSTNGSLQDAQRALGDEAGADGTWVDNALRRLDEERAALERLGDTRAELERVQGQRAGVLAQIAGAAPSDGARRLRAWAATGLMLLLAGVAAWAVRSEPLWLTALALLAGATALTLAPWRKAGANREDAALSALTERADALGKQANDLGTELAALSEAAGFGDPSNLAVELRAAERALMARSAAVETVAAAADAHRAALQAVERLREAVRGVEAERAELDEASSAARRDWDTWLAREGLPPTTRPEALPRIATLIDDGRRAQQRFLGLREKLLPATERAATYSAKVAAVAAALGVEHSPDDVEGNVRSYAASLSRAREEQAALAAARARLEELIRSGQQDLASRFGARAAEAAAELERADPQGWQARSAAEDAHAQQLLEEASELEQRVGRLSQQLDDLGRSSDLASAQLAAEREATELTALARRWLVVRLAKDLIEGTLAEYERTKVPDVLRRAGAHLSTMTGGRYVRVNLHEGRELRVFAPDDTPFVPEQLSRGTYEQLYLAVRFGLVSSFSETNVALPVILDDVLVNADPTRAKRLAREIAHLAEGRQVLYLTCHPHLAELLLTEAPAGALIELPAPSAAGQAGGHASRHATPAG